MLEFNREEVLKKVGKEFELYGFKDTDEYKLSVVGTSDLLVVSYDEDADISFSVKYRHLDEGNYRELSSVFRIGAVDFARIYDINKLRNKGVDIYTYILNSEGYYGNKLVDEYVDEYKTLEQYRLFNQALADILLSLFGYTDR